MAEGWFERQTTEEPLCSALEHYRRGRDAFLDLDYQTATKELEQALRLVPDLPEALNAHVVMAEWQEDHQTAIPASERLVELAPKFLKAWVNLTSMYQCEGRLKDAEYAARMAVRLCPAHSLAHQAKASVESAKRDPDSALVSARRAVELAPDDHDARVGLANILFGSNECAEADEQLERAEELAETKVDRIAILRSRAHDPSLSADDAVGLADTTLQIHPECASSRTLRILRRVDSDDTGTRYDRLAMSVVELEQLLESLPRSARRDSIRQHIAAAEMDCAALLGEQLSQEPDGSTKAAGLVARRRNHAARAAVHLQESLAHARRLDDRVRLDFCLSNLVYALILCRQLKEARQFAAELAARLSGTESADWARDQIRWIDSQLEGRE